MHPYLRGVALAGAICLFCAPVEGAAQALGATAAWASSPNAELPHPRGVGLFAQVDAAGFGFRLSYLRYSDSTRKLGTVCRVYSPRIDCVLEDVNMTARLGGLRADVLRTFGLGELAELGLGGGLSFNSLTATSVGDSGRLADLLMPNTGQIGRQATLSLSVAPVPGVPFELMGSYALHWVKFRGCASLEDRTSGYAPFCGTNRFREIQVGGAFTVPRR